MSWTLRCVDTLLVNLVFWIFTSIRPQGRNNSTTDFCSNVHIFFTIHRNRIIRFLLNDYNINKERCSNIVGTFTNEDAVWIQTSGSNRSSFVVAWTFYLVESRQIDWNKERKWMRTQLLSQSIDYLYVSGTLIIEVTTGSSVEHRSKPIAARITSRATRLSVQSIVLTMHLRSWCHLLLRRYPSSLGIIT